MKYTLLIASITGMLTGVYQPVFAKTVPVQNEVPKKHDAVSTSKITGQLLARYKLELSSKELAKLKQSTLTFNGKAVPALIQVMKDKQYPSQNRWIATFLLGKIMGEKAAPFISRFSAHPDWIMRMASLKTLLALKLDKYGQVYAKALEDESMIVRTQALENIRHLNLDQYAPQVWKMMYDKRNYYKTKDQVKRTELIKKVVRVVGDLKYKHAQKQLLSLAQKPKYDDIFGDIDYALVKLTGKASPSGDREAKRKFWQAYKV